MFQVFITDSGIGLDTGFQQIPQRPDRLAEIRGHRRSSVIQSFVRTTEVIVREVDRKHIIQVFPLLAKAIRQSRESTHRHSHCKVLSFNV